MNEPSRVRVARGHVVKIRMVGRTRTGEVFDATEDKQFVEFTVGLGQVFEAFEHKLIGLEVGERKTFTVPADLAYGLRDETLEREIDRSLLPADYIPAPGDILEAHVDDISAPVRVKRVTDESIVLDLNHPLAGEDLTYDAEIIAIRLPPEDADAPRANGSAGGR